jgi:hypothetical protein
MFSNNSLVNWRLDMADFQFQQLFVKEKIIIFFWNIFDQRLGTPQPSLLTNSLLFPLVTL